MGKMNSNPKPKNARPNRGRQRRRNRRNMQPTTLQHIQNLAMVSASDVSVTNGVYPFTSGKLDIDHSGMVTAGLSWVADYMALFDEYRFTRLEVKWVPAASTLASGNVAFYYDPDPNGVKPTSFQAFTGNAGLKVGRVSQTLRLVVPRERLTRLPWYNTSGSTATARQGSIVWGFSGGNLPNGTGKVSLGHFMITYQLTARNPTGNTASTYTTSVLPTAEQGVLEQLEAIRKELDGRIAQLAANVQAVRANTDKTAACATRMTAKKGTLQVDPKDGYDKLLVNTSRPATYGVFEVPPVVDNVSHIPLQEPLATVEEAEEADAQSTSSSERGAVTL